MNALLQNHQVLKPASFIHSFKIIFKLQAQAEAAMTRLRNSQQFIQAEIPILHRKLQAEKKQFMNLEVSEARCEEVR